MNIYSGLLFQQGFIQDAQLALSLGHGAPHGPSPVARETSVSKPGNDALVACKPFKRGAIAAVCSITLSPFR